MNIYLCEKKCEISEEEWNVENTQNIFVEEDYKWAIFLNEFTSSKSRISHVIVKQAKRLI